MGAGSEQTALGAGKTSAVGGPVATEKGGEERERGPLLADPLLSMEEEAGRDVPRLQVAAQKGDRPILPAEGGEVPYHPKRADTVSRMRPKTSSAGREPSIRRIRSGSLA